MLIAVRLVGVKLLPGLLCLFQNILVFQLNGQNFQTKLTYKLFVY
jgi:hypothetical protein